MKFSSTKFVMRDGSVSPAKTIKKADAGRYEPDRVLFDSIRRSLIDAKEQVMLDHSQRNSPLPLGVPSKRGANLAPLAF